MPKFPLRNAATMTREEKFAVVTAYLSKVVDQLQGFGEQGAQNGFIVCQAPQAPRVEAVAAITDILPELVGIEPNPISESVKKANEENE